MSLGSTLSAISPFGPIFGKELRVTARRKRTYYLRVTYLGLLLVVLLWAYMITTNNRSGGVAAQNQERSQLGIVFFGCFGIFSVYVMGLLGPVLTATAISSERLHKTLPVLLMTPITAWQIVGGKLFSRLLVSLTLIGLGLPVLALVRLLGGVELEQIMGVIALALVAALSSASIGLFFSTLLNRAYAVILLSFGAMLFLYLFIPFVLVLTAAVSRNAGPSIALLEFICAINPYWMVVPAVVPGAWGKMLGLPWAWCISTQLVLSIGLTMWSALILRRRARREGEGGGGAGDPTAYIPFAAASSPTAFAGIAAPAVPLAYAAPGSAVKKSRAPGTVSDNPILWRELRRPLFSRRWQRITAISIIGIMLLTIYALIGANRGLDERETHAGFACVFNFLLAFVVMVLASTAIAQEKESDTWTLLLATPVAGRTVVWGKALGIVRRMIWPMALVAFHFLVFGLFGPITLIDAIETVWIMISFNAIWIATGVYFSLRFSKTTFAVLANIMLAIGAYLVMLAFLASVTELDFSGRRSYRSEIDPRWLSAGAWVFFIGAASWWIAAIIQQLWRKRGALGQLMLASLTLYAAGSIFLAKLRYIPIRDLHEQVGWYAPYFFFTQIGRHGGHRYFPLASRSSFPLGAFGKIVLLGLAQLLLACLVLSLTSWKFSALVGRAAQRKRLQPADHEKHFGRRSITPVST